MLPWRQGKQEDNPELALRRQRQENLYKFKASFVYIVELQASQGYIVRFCPNPAPAPQKRENAFPSRRVLGGRVLGGMPF